VLLDELQEFLVLIDYTRHGHRRAQGAREQALNVLLLDPAFSVGDGITVRVGLRSTEHFVHPIDEPLTDHVLELLGFVVDFVPRIPHDLYEKQLDETMAAQHEGRELFPCGREGDTAYGSYDTRPDSASVLTIVVAVPGATPRADASCPIGIRRCTGGRPPTPR
jgi:hypothetical protein